MLGNTDGSKDGLSVGFCEDDKVGGVDISREGISDGRDVGSKLGRADGS